MSFGYYFEDDLDYPVLLAPLARAEDNIARLDERLRTSVVGEGVAHRVLHREAVGRVRLDGRIVDIEDLVLLDDGSRNRLNSEVLSSAFQILVHWQGASAAAPGAARSLMQAPRPGAGERVASVKAQRDLPVEFYDPDWNEAGRLTEWRTVLRATEGLPATLAAALVMDAWLMLEPEQRGQWRASLLASLLLRAREKTRNFLLPISWGGQKHDFRWSSKLSLNARLAGLLTWMDAAAQKVNDETHKLSLAHEVLQGHLEGRRSNSRLPDLAKLLLNKPVISAPMAAKALGVSDVAIRKMLRELGSVPREMTGRSSYRVWGVVQGL
jgi:hypothetical protein